MTTNTITSGQEYVTATIGGQLFGFPIARVQDVFVVSRVTRVPLAAEDIAGVQNLRGRIVTLIDVRSRLGGGDMTGGGTQMAIGVEANGESYGLLVDAVGEVIRVPDDAHDDVPVHLNAQLAEIASGVVTLDDGLMIIADVSRILDPPSTTRAA